MLAELQKNLVDLYEVDHGYDVRDYLITDPLIARTLGQGALMPNTDESVLLYEDDDGLALSVYLDKQMLDRLDAADPLAHLQAEQLGDFWTVLEGVSHFNYIVWSASRDRSVTLLELEMQAEVDKFVTSSMLALEQGDSHLVKRLHALLFDRAKIKPDLNREQHERYAAASEAFAVIADPVSPWLSVPGLLLFAGITLTLAALRIRGMEISYASD